MPPAPLDAERGRLADDDAGRKSWRAWGPYLSERQWGTVREDYSATGDAWDSVPHDHARSRAYRWGEDGLAGVCDDHQTWCLALALWNGNDPILKERIFGLTGSEGNHGEDAKEYWWYLDNTPTHSWMRWRYHYPQRAFPYDDLVATNRARGKLDPEFELLDTGIFDDDRYWVVTVDYAKADVDDLLMRVTVENKGPDEATIDVLPTLWFRNTWAWGSSGKQTVPRISASGAQLHAEHPTYGALTLVGDGASEALCCDNESNAQRLWGVDSRSRYPKDGINDYLIRGAPTVNPQGVGTKAALHWRLAVPAGESRVVRLRLRAGTTAGELGPSYDAVMAAREREADEFYASLTSPQLSADEANVLRQAFAGMLWCKQFYRYDVDRWLAGDPNAPPPPRSRQDIRNGDWRHLDARDVISMPDKWEYPWFAAWDLAFHCVALVWVDPTFAKQQLLLLCREWYMHPNGQLPAYEWSFSDVNPPVHAWSAIRVFEIDGRRDYEFLERVFHKLLLNFTWWVNRKDSEGNNVFEGGFLGLDNIGPIDRSAPMPAGGHLEQSDGTAWMGKFCLGMLEIAMILAQHDATYEDLAVKFAEHFGYISTAIFNQGLWDDSDGFFYDVLVTGDGRRFPLKVRSMVGLLPLCASATIGEPTQARLPEFTARVNWFIEHRPQFAHSLSEVHVREGHPGRLLAIVTPEQLPRILTTMLDPDEFLSPYGLRALSARHRNEPFVLEVDGFRASVDYEPGESQSNLFGGNSNWRGPIWMPVNYVVIEALRRFARFFGDDLEVEFPTGSGDRMPLAAVADNLSRRLVSIFTNGSSGGRRPVFGDYTKMQTDPAWHANIPFHEYFHGDTGVGLGASHQTGWTGVVADLLMRQGRSTDEDVTLAALPGPRATRRTTRKPAAPSRRDS